MNPQNSTSMPEDRASEAALLGSLLIEPAGIGSVVEHLTVNAFYHVEHRVVYGALLKLYPKHGANIDLVILRDELSRRGQLDDAGGVAYLEQLVNSVPSAANRDYYMQGVLRDCRKREIIRTATNTVNAARSNEGLTDLLVQLEALGKHAEPQQKEGSSAEVADMLAESMQGKRVSLQLPWPKLQDMSKALMPGTVTLLCGGVGASKSLMLLQIFGALMDIPSAVYELEESRAYHLLRALAQESNRSVITDGDWVADNADESRDIYEEHENFVQNMATRIWTCAKQPTLADMALWVECRAREGRQLLAIDPITAAAHTEKETWREDNTFLQRVKQAIVPHGARLILVTHPTKIMMGGMGPDVNSLAGSAAYSRFAQNILWLESHDIKNSTILTDFGRMEVPHSRTVHILKARNGRGAGSRLAYSFDGESLTLYERGLIIKSDKKGNECPTVETGSGYTKPKRSPRKSKNLSTTKESEGESVTPISETKSPLCSDVSPKKADAPETPTIAQDAIEAATPVSSQKDTLARKLAASADAGEEYEGGPNEIDFDKWDAEARAEEEANERIGESFQ